MADTFAFHHRGVAVMQVMEGDWQGYLYFHCAGLSDSGRLFEDCASVQKALDDAMNRRY